MTRVHVVGNCTIDTFFRLDRFPEPGETLIATGHDVDLGGKGANQAVVAARFGVETRLVAPLGDDVEGTSARDRLAAEGLAGNGLMRVGHATDQSIVYVNSSGENTIVSSVAAARAMTPTMALAVLDVAAHDIVMVQGNLTRATTLAVLRRARERGARTFVNPAPIQWGYADVWPLADVAVLNRVEAQVLLGTRDPRKTLAALRAAGVRCAAITLGAEGAVVGDASGATFDKPAIDTNVVDTAGAGDTFCGALAAALARDYSIEAGLDLALRAAAITVARTGTQSAFPTRYEVSDLLKAAVGFRQ